MKKEKKQTEKKEKQPGKIKKFFQKIGTGLKKKWLINSSKTVLLVAIIIAIYIGVNILLEKVVLPEIDCTQNKIYSISQETKDKLGNMDKDVTITLINYSDYLSVISFAERYVELNNHIKIEKVDNLSARADLMQKYSLNANDNLIIISCGENEKTLTEEEMYTFDETTYEQIDITEEAITNAIVNVMAEEKAKIYFMSSHTMYNVELFGSIIDKMKNEVNEVENLDILANGSIPEDCDCLIISTLKEDITEMEKDKIIEYIRNGGKLLLMCGPNVEKVNLSNFQAVLDEYAITIENGIVLEGSSANMVSGYPNFIIEDMEVGTSLTRNLNQKLSICLPDAGKITFNEERIEELGIENEILLTTTEKGFLRTNLNQPSATRTEEDSIQEECILGAVATKKIDEERTSKLVIFANELFAMNMPVQMNGYTMYAANLYNNSDAVLNAIAYLNEKENGMTIRKNYENVNYTVTEQQNTIIMAIIFTLPVVIIIAGIIIWQVRRRKR